MSAELIDQVNELAELQREAAIAKCRINHNAVSATHCLDCGGRDTGSAPGTGGGMPALR